MNTVTNIPTETRPSCVTHVAALAPLERMRIDAGVERIVSVVDGVVAVALEDDDAILTPGHSIDIAAGERARAWNAGDETARVVISACPAAAA